MGLTVADDIVVFNLTPLENHMTITTFGANVPGSNKEIYITHDAWPLFQQLVQRGANLWPDAPPDIKAFADIVTVGKVQQDYHKQANEQPEAPVKKPATFAENIAKFNEMYQMSKFTESPPDAVAARLKQFKKMILDEVSEIDDIIEKIEADKYATHLDAAVDIADVLGDIQVFCASEMLRFDLPLEPTLQIIMDSNFSKLQPDGTALFIDGKLQKGPNYWKPEPKIAEMLNQHLTAMYEDEDADWP